MIGCKGTSLNTNQASPPPAKVNSSANNLRAGEVIKSFKAAGLPIEKEIIYTDENDPNKLLNRPNQYTGKASWADKRLEQVVPEDLKGGTVEVFDSLEHLERRRKYVEEIGKAAPMFTQYQYVHKNALLRLDHDLTPRQAEEYEKILKGL
jgi:hypothetical protein